MDFENKSILITGSSRGIGQATAQAFLDAGARVVIHGRSLESLETALQKCSPVDRVHTVEGDVQTEQSCQLIVDRAASKLGGLDTLINSAGISIVSSLEETTEDIWDKTIDINLKGTYFCSKHALKHLRQTQGAIVNLASDAGLVGQRLISAYCASKGGVVNLTRALALELAPEVRVNCVCPGYVDTDMMRRDFIEQSENPDEAEEELISETPMQRLATPEEIARAIVYLSSHEARFITGAALQIDGGTTAGF